MAHGEYDTMAPGYEDRDADDRADEVRADGHERVEHRELRDHCPRREPGTKWIFMRKR